MMDFLYAVLTSYALTFIVASSAILDRPRFWLMKKTPWLVARGKHMLECRMCSGLWISLGVVAFSDITMWLPVYGASYFLATQERS